MSLAALRPQLGPRDEVVAAVPERARDLDPVLRAQRWIRSVDLVDGSLAAVREAGVVAARNDIVMILDGDTALGARCLDLVAGQFDDPSVVAAGPRCHRSYGPQFAQLDDEDLTGAPAFQARARAWRQEYRGQTNEVDALGPVVFAVRRTALLQIESFDEEGFWPALRPQGRIIVVHEALAAHAGREQCVLHEPFPVDADLPLLSASLIVKDEEDVLADCLRSLAGLVDEIVVYDTGSTDRTKEIAREHGARVIDGYWDDSFGDARNRSIEHCRGRWVLCIDADETAVGDAAAVRAKLNEPDPGEAFTLDIECPAGFGTGAAHVVPAVRLFRRDMGRYVGRLHEQVLHQSLGRFLFGPPLSVLNLVHSGYLGDRIQQRGKHERNLALADREASSYAIGGGRGVGLVLANKARSLFALGKHEECIDTCREGIEGGARGQALRTLLQVGGNAELQRGGETSAVQEWVEQLRQASRCEFWSDLLEVQVRLRDREFEQALHIIDRWPEAGLDDEGVHYTPAMLHNCAISALIGLHRLDEAAQRLLVATEDGAVDLHLGRVAIVLKSGGHSLRAFVFALGDGAWKGVAIQTLQCAPDVADEVLDAMWARRTGDDVVLAAAADTAHRFSVLRALEWSARLRGHGHEQDCPLIRLAGDGSRAARDRAVAAAVAVETFGDVRGEALFATAVPAVPDAEAAEVLAELAVLAPALAATLELEPAS